MDQLPNNKYDNPLFNKGFGENAKALEELGRKIDWRLLTVVYFKCLALLCVTLFSVIATVKLALSLF